MPRLRIGTRRSPLALIQAQRVAALLQNAHPNLTVDLVPMLSEGDRDLVTPLSQLGGKGVFIKSLETALTSGQIDAAVHSFKDVTSQLAPGLTLSAFLAPENPSDGLVMPTHPPTASPQNLTTLPPGSKIGTGSIRRQALIQKLRPDLITVPIRGNVQTRLDLIGKSVDAVMLSYAGLLRLNLETNYTIDILDPTHFIPAPGQGVICVESRANDPTTNAHLSAISDPAQVPISQFHLHILSKIGFDCRIPFGLYADPNQAITVFLANATLDEFWQHQFPYDISETAAEKISKAIAIQAQKWGW